MFPTTFFVCGFVSDCVYMSLVSWVPWLVPHTWKSLCTALKAALTFLILKQLYIIFASAIAGYFLAVKPPCKFTMHLLIPEVDLPGGSAQTANEVTSITYLSLQSCVLSRAEKWFSIDSRCGWTIWQAFLYKICFTVCWHGFRTALMINYHTSARIVNWGLEGQRPLKQFLHPRKNACFHIKPFLSEWLSL